MVRLNLYLQTALFCTVLTDVFGFDYCKLCKGDGKHTMCKFPRDTAVIYNINLTVGVAGLDEELKKEVVHAHNMVRLRVATGKEPLLPPASNMIKLRWHDEAATIAQRWANQSKGGHDACRRLADDTYMGQNGVGGGWDGNYTNLRKAAVKSFGDDGMYCEVRRFDVKDLFFYGFGRKDMNGRSTGHFTQMIWAGTEAVGCGLIALDRIPFTEIPGKTYFMACNYVPGGNVGGSKIYKTGQACSQCESGKCSKQYPGLCLAKDDDEQLTGSPISYDSNHNCEQEREETNNTSPITISKPPVLMLSLCAVATIFCI